MRLGTMVPGHLRRSVPPSLSALPVYLLSKQFSPRKHELPTAFDRSSILILISTPLPDNLMISNTHTWTFRFDLARHIPPFEPTNAAAASSSSSR